ncbi:MAG: hypothetical protein ACXAEU_09325 [Candidatus Hodarchaeales archaeon]|jgi:hypothetical protein
MGRIRVDEKTARLLSPIITSYYDDIRESIAKRLHLVVNRIESHRITSLIKHIGAGGQTFIIQTEFKTDLGKATRRIMGGIVVKFPKEDLEIEIDNAKTLEIVLKKRQKEWNQTFANHSNKRYLEQFPVNIFAPKILGVHEKIKCVVLEFLSNYEPLMGSKEFSEPYLLQLLGYSLGRLHGSHTYTPAMKLYEPFFNLLLRMNIDPTIVDYWKAILSNSKGGVQVIHGDSHLENILYIRPNAIAMIDAMLVPRGERMDDVGYAISHIVQENIVIEVKRNPDKSEHDIFDEQVRHILTRIVPYVLSSYMKTSAIASLYAEEIPIDFFLGTHLIVRADMWEEKVRKILYMLGQVFLVERKVNAMIRQMQ